MTMDSPILAPAWTSRGYALRPETAEDQAFLFHLFVAVRGADFAALALPDTQLQALLASQFSFQLRHYGEAFPDAIRMIATKGDAPVGRLFLNASDGDLRVVDMALLAPCRNTGLGTAVLRAVQEMAAARGASVSLSVHDGNPAERLYRRLGFSGESHDGTAWHLRWSGVHAR